MVSILIDCFLKGEFDARHLSSEINAVPLPKVKNKSEEEDLEKYYAWLIEELKPEVVGSS